MIPRLLIFISLTITTTTSIHVRHTLKHVIDQQVSVSSSDTLSSLLSTTIESFLTPPFNVQKCPENTAKSQTDCGELFLPSVVVGQVVPGGVPAFGSWNLMMGNPTKAANTYTQYKTCAAIGVPAHIGLYQWGVAAPVNGACSPTAPPTLKYVGRSIEPGGLVSRCTDYNPNQVNWAKVGSHRRDRFSTALSSGLCLYYQFASFGAAGSGPNRPYIVCQASVGTGRRPATRKYIKAWSDTEWVSKQETVYINQGREWNIAPGANPAQARCPATSAAPPPSIATVAGIKRKASAAAGNARKRAKPGS